MERTPSTYLPKQGNQAERLEVNKHDNLTSIVLIGSNGSGKSRLGAWIEKNQYDQNIYRISAQRALTIPQYFPIKSVNESLLELYTGFNNIEVINKQSRDNLIQQRISWKWGNNQTNHVLNNFVTVVSTLFAQKILRDHKYYKKSMSSDFKPDPIESSIDKLNRIWSSLLPHRQLQFIDNTIKVKTVDSNEYLANELSDGERVIIYMLGHCLCVPESSIIIIDEPEIHIHKAIINQLWTMIESERPDCLFIYLTQDLEFAASRKNSKIIWMKSFDGNNWDWEEIQNEDDLPETLLLEILGSRKNILFVEGNKGSSDYSIYQEIYSEFTVIPCGGCDEVKRLVKSFRAKKNLHKLEIFGLIDRDFRSEEEIQKLNADFIFILDVAEIENLFCVKEIINLVSEIRCQDKEEDFKKVKEKVLEKLKHDLEFQISTKTAREIKNILNEYPDKVRDIGTLESKKSEIFDKVDINTLYNSNKALYESLISNEDYCEILKYYNQKGLVSEISSILGEANGNLNKAVIRYLKSPKYKNEVINALKPYLPDIK